MGDDPNQHQHDLKEQIAEYRKLQAISGNEEFKDYFDYCMRVVVQKMIWGFGNHTVNKQPVDNIQNWDDFCKWRGEIVARLQPIQEIYGAEYFVEYLSQSLDNLYKKQVS